VPEKHSQALGQTECEESVRKAQQEIILRVLGEKQGSFLTAGRAEMKAFAAEGTEQLLSAFRVSALYAGDSPGVITAGDETLSHLCDPLQSEPPVCVGVLLLIVFGKLSEVLFEDSLKDVRSALSIGGGWIRGLQSERQLWVHIDI